MNRLLPFFTVIILLLAASACGSKKPPQQTTVKTRNILSVLMEMSRSYEQKNIDAFLSDVSNTYHDRESFAKSLIAVFSKYETIHFNIQYAKMIIMIEERGRIKSTFTWDAEWASAGGTTVKDGGRVTLVFEPDSFKLASIEGKNPFLAQPGETPGK